MRIGIALGDTVEQVDVPEDDLLHFPEGIIGFEELTRFALFEANPPLYLLQSVDDPLAGFVVIDPFLVDDSYRVGSDVNCGALDLGDEDRRTILCLVTLAPSGLPQSVNMRAPLVINSTRKKGLQVILQEDWQVRHPLSVSADGGLLLRSDAAGARRR